MPTEEEYEKRLCITYLDEADAFTNSNYNIKSIVSLTTPKKIYIDCLEKAWKALRAKYKVPEGLYLHFSDIKNLLSNQNTHKAKYKHLFCDTTGNLDNALLHSFYTDVLGIISTHNFVIQATGIAARKNMKDIYGLVKTKNIMYQLFREHMDRMAFHLIKLSVDDYHTRKAKNSKVGLEYFLTKLRYDGGYSLSDRNSYREAYSHSISDGTRHFSDDVIKDVFDTLSFIPKDEVGLCTNCVSPCGHELISHAGAELIDFITLYVARDMWKDFYIDLSIKEGSKKATVENNVDKLCSIQIPGYPSIIPINTIKPKIAVDQYLSTYYTIVE